MEVPVGRDWAGGAYYLKAGSQLVSLRFFVLSFSNRQFAVAQDWNLETIKMGDLLRGKVTLKTFGNPYKSAQYSYTMVNSNNSVVDEKKDRPLNQGGFDVILSVPRGFGGFLSFSVEIKVDGVSY